MQEASYVDRDRFASGKDQPILGLSLGGRPERSTCQWIWLRSTIRRDSLRWLRRYGMI